MTAAGSRGEGASLGLAPDGAGQKRNMAIRGAASLAVKPAPAGMILQTGRRSSAFARLEHEHYVEEPWVSRRLLEEMRFGALPRLAGVFDPAAGFGHVVASARELRLPAEGSDLVARAPGIEGGRDFLSGAPERELPPGWWIVSNPPFLHIRGFIERALALASAGAGTAMLVPTRRLNAAAWLADLPLLAILHVTPRPSMWPGTIYRQRVEAGLPLRNGREDVSWLVFEKGERFCGRSGWLHRDGAGA